MREPVAPSEVGVEHEHVGTSAVELYRELGSAWGRGYNGQVGLGIDQPPEACEHGRVVIENGYVEH